MAMPGGLSADPYLERQLRPLDAEHFSGAGFLPFRRTADDRIEVLLTSERPWNSMTHDYDPLGWNISGGKRIPRQERTAETTATRCFLETLEEVSPALDVSIVRTVISQCGFVLWYPLGKFALLAADVTDMGMDDVPERFRRSKSSGEASQEYKVNAWGIKRWVKNIDAVEWVDGKALAEASSSQVCDLLLNYVKINAFSQFLQCNLDLSSLPVVEYPPVFAAYDSWGGKKGNGNSKGGGKGWHNGRSSWKGESSWGMQSWGPPKGQSPMMPMYGGGGMKGGGKFGMVPTYGMDYSGFDGAPPPPPMPMTAAPVAPMMMPQPASDNSPELQRQIYGEQLYMLVQPLSPSPYLAQKITGMLLELPMQELMMNLTNTEELRRRVEEALEVLREDGILQ
eukprot:TRINITY_DN111852_c0_g1_i1.p1 TRINITY_DN111852_c0_g1~~TRINITY_DN111852_c0_g1_i1.p1  ORF type:complete len:396 (+),score=81.92 TRINITY_DN111852_c0_g1_i1:60-1247(+)